MTDEEVSIQSFDVLVQYLEQNKDFGVWWNVRCEIGPEWVGSKREVCFVLDGKSLSDSDFHKHLKDKLIKIANIPENSSSHVINGEGDIQLKDGKLIVNYWWTAAIPYQDSDQSGHGEGVLHA